ncbi:LPD7 domain-containing protein [Sphingomonas sp. FARSPH]|uniref:LPD7 domain-containing protein n=1 Tax=Sphingomonas sp. FARSPH TaxID=2219696 RepID=UPI001E311232|nr:LPD7 domain-containing protein [Sphingomonas sp. FARSPH]
MADQANATPSGPDMAARKRNNVDMPAELESRFLRVGNKLYRSAHDKTPVATISADRIKAKDASSLPDLVRLAKANGWTSLKISGDEEFKRAAYLAASAQGIRIDGYKPDEKTKAAADREQARQAAAAPTKEQASRTANQARDNKEQADPAKDLAERFRRQTDVQNAKDPDLKRAQSHVAHAVTIASGRFPNDTTKQREFVAERKEEIAGRLQRGEQVAGIEVKQQQTQRIREMQQDQVLQKTPTRGR